MDAYQPLDPKDLERGYFFLTHRRIFERIALIAAIVVIAVFYVVAIVNLVSLVRSQSYDELAQVINTNYDWAAYHQSRAPQELVISSTDFISLGDQRYDLVAFVKNPNSDWALREFQYRFVINDEPQETRTAFLNPGEEAMVIQSGFVAERGISNLDLEIGQTQWRRFAEGDTVVLWDISGVKFQPISRQEVDGKEITVLPRASWRATNKSLYDFWEVDWQVALFNGSDLVGVREVKSLDFASLDSKELEAVWINDLSRVTKTLVWPRLNWLDQDNFKNPVEAGNEGEGESNRFRL